MTTSVLKHRVNKIEQILPFMRDLIHDAFEQAELRDGIKRIAFEIPQGNILRWYTRQHIDTKMFWSDRENKFATAGIHTADILSNGKDPKHTKLFDTIRARLADVDEHTRYFGGIKFDVTTDISKEWESFGSATFILPRFEVTRFESKYYFVCNLIFPQDKESKKGIIEQLLAIDFSDDPPTPYDNEIVERTDLPERAQWIESINAALEGFAENRYGKIVLARKTGLHFKNNIKPDKILYQLYKNTSNCFHFCFQTDTTNAFLGATPERLYFRNKRILKCEAVAGTRRRDSDDRIDYELGQDLLHSKKDIREHRFVIDSILETLTSLTNNDVPIDENELTIVKLTRVQHLLKRFRCELKPNITDFDLVNGLHPTAAVGGYPKEAALKDIKKLERFDRGWYASPVGWIGKDTAEFAVALRCGLVHDNQLNLYSGAGIIDGSDPENEWDEIENKISNFLKALS